MEDIAASARAAGHRPYIIPLGASTPLGAVGFALAVAELAAQIDEPDAIVHASSSGGTQAGLVAGCHAVGWKTKVIGISADEPAATLRQSVLAIVHGIHKWLPAVGRPSADSIVVDDRFIGEGYGVASERSCEAQSLAATTEALFLDHTYTAKAMAGLLGLLREGFFARARTIVFWHTGGQPTIFA
jgi:1-aminocyclopropane-1-carboxylate deaminase/D-cysteine desulfhydrase-like pyridoxal-dependent ACC family enzyme